MCQRTTNAINFIFHNMGFDAVSYLDDFGGWDTIAQADLAFHKLGSLLKQLGIAESEDKAFAPSQIMVFLGSKFNTIDMTISVPQEKLTELIDLVKVRLHKTKATKRQLQSLIGKLQFAAHCVRPGWLFIARLLRKVRTRHNDHVTITVDDEFKKGSIMVA